MFNYAEYFIKRYGGLATKYQAPLSRQIHYINGMGYEIHMVGTPRWQHPSWILAKRNPRKFL